MPILSEEVSLYPEGLLNGMQDEPSDRRWWVLHAKPRQEKAISRNLLAHEIPFYLPLVKKRSCIRGRRVTANVPVFSGYMFLYGSEDERGSSLTTNRIVRVLEVHDPERLRTDLTQLQRLIASEAPLTLEARLAPGRRVRVRLGPFAEMEGTVVMRQGRTRLIVAVNFLQQGASVEVDDFMVDPID
ncbi:MAG: transcription termination/antitermination NusG family protein [Planctomycetota bacterium]